MKYVPNLLSLSRIPLSVALFYFAVNNNWSLAVMIFMVALLTDALDGYIARRYDVVSEFGGDVLETVCDLTLSIAAVAGLYFSGEISLWVLVALAVVTALLQVTHWTSFSRLKRHTYYLHPLFFLAVVYLAGEAYIILSFDANNVGVQAVLDVFVLVAYQVAWVLAGFLKWDRVKTWLAGPPSTS